MQIETIFEDCQLGKDTLSGRDISVAVFYDPNKYDDEAKYEVESWNPATWEKEPRSNHYKTECKEDALKRAKMLILLGW